MNSYQIIEKLNSEFTLKDAERRSIYRDIKMLQYCGYRIIQCRDKRKGWYMEHHVFEDWEIKIMMDAVQEAKCVPIDEAIVIQEKLLNLTSSRGRRRFSHLIKPVKMNTEADVAVGDYIEMMLEAMYLNKKIEFQYTEINNDMQKVIRRNGKIYKLNLYTIHWSNDNYYLIGSHDNHEGITHYRLDRIINLKISEENAVDARIKIGPNPETYISDYVKSSVNNFSGDLIHITVEYCPNPINNAILYDFAGGSIKVSKLHDNRYRAVFSKRNSVTLTAWFLQYVNRFKVVGPEKLIYEIKRELKAATESYEI